MISEKARKIADACRFCWMCRHTCPVGLVTGKESNTPRARGLLVSMDSRGIPLSGESVGAMFQCCLCGACTNDCATGWDPTVFIREGRRDAVVKNFLPPEMQRVLDHALDGDMTGEPRSPDVQKAVEALPKKEKTLLFLGHSGWRGGEKASLSLITVLRQAGVSFTVLSDEPDSGAQLYDLMGMTDDLRQVAAHCLDRIRDTGAKTIIALDPSCARFFKHECEGMGLLEGLSVVTATAFVETLITTGALEVRAFLVSSATFHDPCRLARDLDETESARNILKALGVTVNEMFLHRKSAKCCGGPVLGALYPSVGEDVAKARWAETEITCATLLVTACPACMEIMAKSAPEGRTVRDIFELVAKACE